MPEKTETMPAAPNGRLRSWLPWILAVIALIGWCYRLDRDVAALLTWKSELDHPEMGLRCKITDLEKRVGEGFATLDGKLAKQETMQKHTHDELERLRTTVEDSIKIGALNSGE